MDITKFITARLDEDEFDTGKWVCQWHDNERLLREVAAKRAILTEARAVARLNDLTDGQHDEYRAWILRQLAAVWSDHRDYDQDWAT